MATLASARQLDLIRTHWAGDLPTPELMALLNTIEPGEVVLTRETVQSRARFFKLQRPTHLKLQGMRERATLGGQAYREAMHRAAGPRIPKVDPFAGLPADAFSDDAHKRPAGKLPLYATHVPSQSSAA